MGFANELFARAHLDDVRLAKQLQGKSIMIEHNIGAYVFHTSINGLVIEYFIRYNY